MSDLKNLFDLAIVNHLIKIPDVLQWLVVATEPRVIDKIRKAPEGALSSMDAMEEVNSFRSLSRCSPVKTCLVTSNQIHSRRAGDQGSYHIPIIRAQLSRALPQLVPALHEEVADILHL